MDAGLQRVEDAITVEQLLARSQLTGREALVIERRFFDGETLKAIGREAGLSDERVRQIEWKALWKLSKCAGVRFPREPVRSKPLRDAVPVVFELNNEQARADDLMSAHNALVAQYVRNNWDRLCDDRAAEWRGYSSGFARTSPAVSVLPE